MEKKYYLQVFVAGIAPDTQTLLLDLKEQLSHKIGDGSYTLKVIDVLEMPQVAEEEHILATPTVVRSTPAPVKKIILNPNQENEAIAGVDLIIED